MPVQIISTLSCDNEYIVYDKLGNIEKRIYINGKANVTDKKTLITKSGVVTSVSEEDHKLLEENYHFRQHKENGFIEVSNAKKVDGDSVSKNMAKKDKSAQLKEEDMKGMQAKVVK